MLDVSARRCVCPALAALLLLAGFLGSARAGSLGDLIGAGLPQYALRERTLVVEPPGPGATITVTSAAGAPIGPIHDGDITLWEAIHYANADPNPNLINFASELNGKTIDVGLLDWLTLVGNNDALDGSYGAGRPHVRLVDSLEVQNAIGVTIRGLCVNSIILTGTQKCHVESCHFGLDLDGKTTWKGAGLVEGVEANGTDAAHPSKANVIGGKYVIHRNFFAGDSPGFGGGPVLRGDYCSDNWVFNNNIGLGRDDKPVANTPWGGISVQEGAHDNHVGDWPNRWNTVVCTEVGVYLDGANTQHNVVRSNYLGYHSGGASYAHYGITLSGGAHDNVIGGPVADDYLPNVIDFCDTAGISIGPGCVGTRIYGTYIGVDQTGLRVEKGGGKVGIEVGMNSVSTRIGGADTWRNWIAGQSDHAIEVLDGATGVAITGNYIGFVAGWQKPFFYGATPGDGIFASGAADVRIGGARETPIGWLNVIGGCDGVGVKLKNCTGPVTVESNWLGIAPSFSQELRNGTDIEVVGSQDVVIGTDRAEGSSGSAVSALKPPPSATRGNVITCARCGVHIGSSQNVKVMGNLVGSDHNGGEYDVRQTGIVVDNDSSQVDIGGDTSGQTNRIRQCPQGILVNGGAHGVRIVGNDMQNSSALVGDDPGVRVEGGAHNVVVRGNAIKWWAVGIMLLGDARDVTIGATAPNQSGNRITQNQVGGVWIDGGLAYDNQILGNWIGVLPSDDPLKPLMWVEESNGVCGVEIRGGAHHNVIGADVNGTPNRICANDGPGVRLTEGAHHNVVRNGVGPERPENEITGNTKGGVLIDGGAHDNTIGGADPAHPTYIGGNTGNGVTITGAGSDNNRIVNSRLGLCGYQTEDLSYSFACGNTGHGVYIGEGAKGNALGARSLDTYSNVISANGGDGVHLQGAGTTGNQVSRCRIGTDPTGNEAQETGPHPKTWANHAHGVQILQGAQGNIVGGVNNAFGNQISNNRADGVYLGQQSIGNDVSGNLIGTRADGAQALGNGETGITIEADCSQNRIGSGKPSDENTISGNGLEGVLIFGGSNIVARNFIGTDLLGGTAVPNGRAGIRIVAASQNQVLSGNVVSGNRGDGIVIAGGTSEGNVVDGNWVGLTKSAARFLPNGAAAPGTGAAVLVAPQSGGVALPNTTQVSNNWLYGVKCGIRFAAQSFGDEAIPNGNRATGNKIGLTRAGQRRVGDVGIALVGCSIYVAGNEIAGQKAGVQVQNATADACVRSCNFHHNQCDVQFLAGAGGLLGDAGSSRSWELGGNLFAPTSQRALDVYAGRSGFTFKAENNDWGTQSKAEIEARIVFHEGDTSHTSVDYDPLINGVHPTRATSVASAMVTALAAQPTPQGAAITLSLSADAAVTVVITNLAGRPIRTLIVERPLAGGVSTITWDGVSNAGTRVPAGSYLVQVSARSASGRQVRAMRTLTLGQAVR